MSYQNVSADSLNKSEDNPPIIMDKVLLIETIACLKRGIGKSGPLIVVMFPSSPIIMNSEFSPPLVIPPLIQRLVSIQIFQMM